MRKFEAHITCPRESSAAVEAIGNTFGWTFSAIDGDPVMGKRAYCYLSGFIKDDWAKLVDQTHAIADVLRYRKIEVLREKVEEIIHDTKTGVDCRTMPCHGLCGSA